MSYRPRGHPPPGRRNGMTLVELLVALVLGGVLLGSAFTLLSGLAGATRLALERWDRMEALRTVWVTVERELRPGVPGRDWKVTTEDELALRSFRGIARICGPGTEPGEYRVAWRGERLPVADRDSVVVLGRDGGWRSALLVRWIDDDGCSTLPGEIPGRMAWTGAGSEPPVLVRLFVRGAYSLRAGAFRYRRGAAGRQPLTPEVFDDGSRFLALPSGVAAQVDFLPTAGSDGSGARSTRLRFFVQVEP